MLILMVVTVINRNGFLRENLSFRRVLGVLVDISEADEDDDDHDCVQC